MDDNERDQFIAELLDASLRRYQIEEPPAGLEGRILASVQSAERRAQGVQWTWAAAAAAMAVAIVAVVLLRSPGHHEVPTIASSPPEVTRPVAPEIAPPAPAPPVVPAKSITRARRTPAWPTRPAQFPTPAPLSEQEKLLLLYVRSVPASELAPKPDDGEIEPITIPALKIAALEIKPLNFNEDSDEK